MLYLLSLVACGSPEINDTGPAACAGSPQLSISSPADGATFAFGERITLEGEGTSSVDAVLEFLWAINEDVVNTSTTGHWTADVSGILDVTFQGKDRCGTTQEIVKITVTPDPDDTGADDTGADDTGAETDALRATPSATTFGAEAGLPARAWNWLSSALGVPR